MTPAKQYDGEKKNLAELSVIKAHVGIPFTDEIHSTISGYASGLLSGEPVTKAFGIRGFTDYPHDIQVLPGQYDVELYCFKVPTYDFHRTVKVLVRPGYTYLLKCVPEGGDVRAVLASEEKTRLQRD